MTTEVQKVHKKLKDSFHASKTRSYDWRIHQLTQLKKMLKENEKLFIESLHKDLRRPNFECIGLELIPLVIEIEHAISNLKAWMKPELVKVPIFMAPASCEIHHQPLGVCLIISAFNYPIELALGPLIGAISAGNCAVIKPSELAPSSEILLTELILKYLDNECFGVICGGVETTTHLLDQAWDKIFFTGSPRVGKIVMAAAAKHLTSVTLELGGKSPVIVDDTVTDLALVARRICWGKCSNAGQTCIAPDYIICHEKMYDKLVTELKATLLKFFGDEIQKSNDFARIISNGHCQRLKVLLEENKDKILFGGKYDLADKFIEPTILGGLDNNSNLLKEEIFGPLLPILKFKEFSEIQSIISNVEKPLTLYVFSKRRKFIDLVINNIQSGSLMVNDTLMHFANAYLPFGGIGNSGLGGYHGKFSYEEFSQKRSVTRRDDHYLLDISLRYPPYTEFGAKFFKLVTSIPPLPAISQSAFKLTSGIAIGTVVITVVLKYIY